MTCTCRCVWCVWACDCVKPQATRAVHLQVRAVCGLVRVLARGSWGSNVVLACSQCVTKLATGGHLGGDQRSIMPYIAPCRTLLPYTCHCRTGV